jgi:hypothetical protein
VTHWLFVAALVLAWSPPKPPWSLLLCPNRIGAQPDLGASC